MSAFVSSLGPAMANFLDYKHALGIKYTTAAVYLCELDRYNAAHGNHHTLVKEIVDGWVLEHVGKSTTGDRSWIPPIREFGRYLVNTGDTEAYVLDDSFIIQRYHPDVYLMTEAEIHCFLRNAISMSSDIKLLVGHMFFRRYTALCIAAVSDQQKQGS